MSGIKLYKNSISRKVENKHRVVNVYDVYNECLQTLYGQHVLGLPQAELCLDLTHELPAVLPGEADDGEGGRLAVDGEPGVQFQQGGPG